MEFCSAAGCFYLAKREHKFCSLWRCRRPHATLPTPSRIYMRTGSYIYKRHLKLSLFNEPHSHSFSSARAHTGSCGRLLELVVQLGHTCTQAALHACSVYSPCTKNAQHTHFAALKSLAFLPFHKAVVEVFKIHSKNWMAKNLQRKTGTLNVTYLKVCRMTRNMHFIKYFLMEKFVG